MILFRIATGFYIWDVYKWLSVFLLTAFAAGLYISVSVRYRGGRLVPERRGGKMDYSGLYPIERFGAEIARLIFNPWAKKPAAGLIALGVLAVFFYTAIFLR